MICSGSLWCGWHTDRFRPAPFQGVSILNTLQTSTTLALLSLSWPGLLCQSHCHADQTWSSSCALHETPWLASRQHNMWCNILFVLLITTEKFWDTRIIIWSGCSVLLASSVRMNWITFCCSFQDILVAKGYNGGKPITREYFDEHISGGHNILLGKFLWPDWSQEDRDRFADEKEALFREYSGKHPCNWRHEFQLSTRLSFNSSTFSLYFIVEL